MVNNDLFLSAEVSVYSFDPVDVGEFTQIFCVQGITELFLAKINQQVEKDCYKAIF